MDLLSRNSRSLFGRLKVEIKLSIGFSMSVAAVLADSLPFLSTLLLIGIVVFGLSGPNHSQVKLVWSISVLLVWGLIFSQSIFYSHYPRDTLLTIVDPNPFFREGLRVYLQGIHHGATQSFRMLAIGFVGYAICFSTEPDEFLAGLMAFKVPFSLAFMAVSAIQFVPIVVEEVRQIRIAMVLKGYRPFRAGIWQTVQTEIGTLGSVLAGTIRRSEEKALSIMTRGFDIRGTRTSLYDSRLKPKEVAVQVALFSVVFGLLAVKTLFWLYQNQIFGTSRLRTLYEFTRVWL